MPPACCSGAALGFPYWKASNRISLLGVFIYPGIFSSSNLSTSITPLPTSSTPRKEKEEDKETAWRMEQQVLGPKWEAKVSRKLRNASGDQIWPFLQDFFGIHKWFPSLSASYGTHGNNGEIGSIRYCQGSSIPSQSCSKINDQDTRPTEISWSKEKLIAIDSAEKSLSYEIVDSNIGFNSYVSTMKIISGGGNRDQAGCVIEWSFTVDPVAGLRFEDLVKKYELGLQRMVEKMEGSLGNIGN